MLIGAAAISALPPLNGFASEWMVFQAILASPALPVEGLRFLVPAVGAVLALVAALAAACFVRAYGIAFLGRPRSPEAANAHEVDRVSLAAMALMAAPVHRRRRAGAAGGRGAAAGDGAARPCGAAGAGGGGAGAAVARPRSTARAPPITAS